MPVATVTLWMISNFHISTCTFLFISTRQNTACPYMTVTLCLQTCTDFVNHPCVHFSLSGFLLSLQAFSVYGDSRYINVSNPKTSGQQVVVSLGTDFWAMLLNYLMCVVFLRFNFFFSALGRHHNDSSGI